MTVQTHTWWYTSCWIKCQAMLYFRWQCKPTPVTTSCRIVCSSALRTGCILQVEVSFSYSSRSRSRSVTAAGPGLAQLPQQVQVSLSYRGTPWLLRWWQDKLALVEAESNPMCKINIQSIQALIIRSIDCIFHLLIIILVVIIVIIIIIIIHSFAYRL